MAAFGLSFEQKSKKLKILDEPAKPFEHLKWANGRTLDLATYMKEHPYMYASDNVRAVFRVAKAMVSDVIDLFGTEVTFSDEDDAGVTVTAYTNEMAMEQFALNFAPDVTVLEPQRLREKVKNALEKALEKYNQWSDWNGKEFDNPIFNNGSNQNAG